MLRRNRLFRSRKGDDMLTDFFAVIAFAVIILLFFLLFTIKHNSIDKDLKTQFSYKEGDYMLTAFLRAPAIGVDSSKTVADIIEEDSVTGDYKRTSDLFKAYFYTSYNKDSNIRVFLRVYNSYGTGQGDYGLCYDFGSEDYTTTPQCYVSKGRGPNDLLLKSETYIPDNYGKKKIIYVSLSVDDKNG